MKCMKHKRRVAVAVCSFCGAALCPDCADKTTDGRWVCSTICRRVSGTITRGFECLQKQLELLSDVQIMCAIGAGVIFFLTGLVVLVKGLWPLTLYLMAVAVVCVVVGVVWRRKEIALRGH